MKHLVHINDFSVQELTELIKVGEDISVNTAKYSDVMKGRILATLFFEPSTRTRLSFESAMLRLGGSVVGFSEASNSSVAKGETIEDTVLTVEQYADVIAMRHPVVGSAERASQVLTIPLINGGDGGNQHPTQTLTDLLTIQKEKGTLHGLKIAMIGDLKHGRTVHSLTNAMSRFDNNKFMFVSPKELRMPDEIKNTLDADMYTEHESIESVIAEADVIYMTRIQRERFEDQAEYERLKDVFVLDTKKMQNAKDNAIVMHPLPRVNEIHPSVDKDPRAKYFKQAQNGMFIRMALIMKLVFETCEQNFTDDLIGGDNFAINENIKNSSRVSYERVAVN